MVRPVVTSDDLYRWRATMEQLSAELLTASADERDAIRKRLDALADEFFELYLDALQACTNAPHGIAKCPGVPRV